MDNTKKATIDMQSWGYVDGKVVKKFTIRNGNNQEVDVISYGATVTAIRTPDKNGKVADVVLGFDNIEGYLTKENPYFGATVGRVANRIGKARFTLNGVEYNLAKNVGQNTLHGGVKGWNSKIWESTIEGESVVMTLLSEDGDEGFPGNVVASVTFKLSECGEFIIEMKSSTTKATPINLTNHGYFNLAGHDANASELYKHVVTVNGDRWTVTDSESIPTGEIRPVAGSVMDLRRPTVLGDVINSVPGGGYDYNFCLPQDNSQGQEQFVAKAHHSESGRYMEVYSNQPGVQIYTANFLPDPAKDSGVLGKEGKRYFKHGAICFETQNYPDAVNHANFPDSILRPGHLYHHTVTYKFEVQH